MIESVFNLLGAALTLWNDTQKNYFLKKYIKLKTDYYHEKNQDKPDHSILDNIEFELFLLSNTVSSEITRSSTQNMPK